MSKLKTYLTGIKPTGDSHLGNYFGAIKPAIDFSKSGSSQERFLYFIADYHALTGVRDPKIFSEWVYSIAATWLSLGLDPQHVYFYRQSQIPEVFELNWLLACMTPKGDMNRAHAYKSMVTINEEKQNPDIDAGINMGLYTYPILMAADILLFDTNVVPVGKDQVQHVEITRSIAQRINEYFGSDTLVEPKEYLSGSGSYVPGLDGRKMSKSYQNGVMIFEEENKLRKLINRIKTDSLDQSIPKDPDQSLLMDFYKLVASPTEIADLSKRYNQGIGWGEVKAILFEAMNDHFKEARMRYQDLMKNKDYIDQVLNEGAEKAREIAIPVLQRVRLAMTGRN